MTRRSQTEAAVLGALSVQPMTGYAVREAIRDVLGHFWSESFGQIYPTLAELERRGYVIRRAVGRTRSSTFVVTAAGEAHLRGLLAQPIQPETPRNGLLLRLFFGRHLGPDACRALLMDAGADAKRSLAGYHAIRRQIESEPGNAADRPYWLLTVAAGEHSTRAALAWVDASLAALDELGGANEGTKS